MTERILETERLILRELVADDGEFMNALLNSPGFLRYIGDRGVRTTEEASEFIQTRYRKSYHDNGYGLYGVEIKEGEDAGKSIGICGFVRRDALPDADIGFAFLPEFEKRGYAFEAASATMKFGRERLGFTRVLAITTPNNEGSERLLRKLGFELLGLQVLEGDPNPVRVFSFDA
jgi:RimJ/RimL family protein N-acetyltransferase